MILRTLSFLLLIPLSACYIMGDPYDGKDGVRVNINGHPYQTKSFDTFSLNKDYIEESRAAQCQIRYDEECCFSLTVYLKKRAGEGFSPDYGLKLDLSSPSPFVMDKDYEISGNAATLTKTRGDKISEPVPIQGWIRFLSIGSGKVLASFELSSDDYSLKHGFLRLPAYLKDNTQPEEEPSTENNPSADDNPSTEEETDL